MPLLVCSTPALWQVYSQRDPSKPSTVRAAARFLHRMTGKWSTRHGELNDVRLVQAAAIRAGAELDAATQEWIAEVKSRQETERQIAPVVRVCGLFDATTIVGSPDPSMSLEDMRLGTWFEPVLPPNVRVALTAMALSEHRSNVVPWLLPAPETEDVQSAGLREGQQVVPMWFAGDHIDVAGGHSEHGLSDLVLIWLVACLRDTASNPLLHVDLDELRFDLGMRQPWAKQELHRNRQVSMLLSNLTVTRQVMGHVSSIPSGLVAVPEHLHHSVTVNGNYSISSPQFDSLRSSDLEALTALWNAASDAASLLPTERELRWTETL